MDDFSTAAMTKTESGGGAKPSVTIIKPDQSRSLVFDIKEIWKYRELFLTLATRDIKVRYKQSVLGILWILIQPIATCIVFTFVFGHLVRIESGATPYPVFVFSGLLLWQFFSRNLGEGVSSLIANSAFINKVYFPRIGIPLIGIFSSAIDFILGLVVLFALMLWYGVDFRIQMLVIPFVLLATISLSFSIALVFSPLNAIYRDVGLMVGYGTQFLMYLSPVIYPVTFVPEKYHWIYDFNPVATLLNTARWALVGTAPPSDMAALILFLTTLFLFVVGRTVFRALEPSIVDRI
jgi:lipopolysaccharide transport system permease protein